MGTGNSAVGYSDFSTDINLYSIGRAIGSLVCSVVGDIYVCVVEYTGATLNCDSILSEFLDDTVVNIQSTMIGCVVGSSTDDAVVGHVLAEASNNKVLDGNIGI